MTTPLPSKFDDEITECIERGISLFGNTVSTIILWHCGFNSKLDKREIPQKPDLFEQNVKILFGDSAASIIRTITKEIRITFHLRAEECANLGGAIQAARTKRDEEIKEETQGESLRTSTELQLSYRSTPTNS